MTVNASERQVALEEEVLLVRHSGEIPEVALHASLHYLCDDIDGPRLRLTLQERGTLEAAVVARYQEIILRDLTPGNRKLSLFRGIRRANHNWYRFVRFSEKIGLVDDDFRHLAVDTLLHYLQTCLQETGNDSNGPAVNCSPDAMLTFAIALGIDETSLPKNWQCLCEKTA